MRLRRILPLMTRLTIRIDFEQEGSFGPGKARLLEHIGTMGSLRRAAVAMKMSYRQAWLLIQAAEASFGAPLVDTETGGARGGGSRLTDLGREVLRRYRKIEQKSAQAVRPDVSALTRLAAGTGPRVARSIRLRPSALRSPPA